LEGSPVRSVAFPPSFFSTAFRAAESLLSKQHSPFLSHWHHAFVAVWIVFFLSHRITYCILCLALSLFESKLFIVLLLDLALTSKVCERQCTSCVMIACHWDRMGVGVAGGEGRFLKVFFNSFKSIIKAYKFCIYFIKPVGNLF